MRELNSVEHFLRRFRRSEPNCLEHFQLSNMQGGTKCLSCTLDAEWVSKKIFESVLCREFQLPRLLQGHGRKWGLEAELHAIGGRQTAFDHSIDGIHIPWERYMTLVTSTGLLVFPQLKFLSFNYWN